MARREPAKPRRVRVVAAGTPEEEQQAWREVSIILWRALSGANGERPIRVKWKPPAEATGRLLPRGTRRDGA